MPRKEGNYIIHEIPTEADEGSTEFWRDTKAYFKERNKAKQDDATERIHELTSLVGQVSRNADDTIWQFVFKGHTLQYYPTKGKWYASHLMKRSMQGGFDSFLGWLRNQLNPERDLGITGFYEDGSPY